MGNPHPTPHVSIVIPVYNEEAILHAAVVDLRERLAPHAWDYEILLAENGSVDGTVQVAQELSDKYPQVSFLCAGKPNYGKALRLGIQQARGQLVVCDEIDLCDTDFHTRAVDLLDRGQSDLVVGSKLVDGSQDRRPWPRHAASIAYTGLLRVLVGYSGTDTHGLKAFRRSKLIEIVDACLVERDVFASELVVRAYRRGLRVTEIPVRVVEKRPPSINLARRIPNVLGSLARLTWAIRFKG